MEPWPMLYEFTLKDIAGLYYFDPQNMSLILPNERLRRVFELAPTALMCKYFLENPNRVIPHKELSQHVFGDEQEIITSRIRTHVNLIRGVLADHQREALESVYRGGYQLNAEVQEVEEDMALIQYSERGNLKLSRLQLQRFYETGAIPPEIDRLMRLEAEAARAQYPGQTHECIVDPSGELFLMVKNVFPDSTWD